MKSDSNGVCVCSRWLYTGGTRHRV